MRSAGRLLLQRGSDKEVQDRGDDMIALQCAQIRGRHAVRAAAEVALTCVRRKPLTKDSCFQTAP